MRGVLFEQSSVIAEAQAKLNGDGVTDRCQLVGGSFFDSVPTGGDAYILKHVIHNWADDHAAVILKNCRQSINPLGKLLIVERPIPSGNRPSAGKLFDISMMVTAGGQERSEIEFAALLRQSGFRLSRMIPTELPMAVIIEATPV